MYQSTQSLRLSDNYEKKNISFPVSNQATQNFRSIKKVADNLSDVYSKKKLLVDSKINQNDDINGLTNKLRSVTVSQLV